MGFNLINFWYKLRKSEKGRNPFRCFPIGFDVLLNHFRRHRRPRQRRRHRRRQPGLRRGDERARNGVRGRQV